jgi:acylphosphatase
MADERLHARIHGRVQGVFFRAMTRRRASELGLTGWVLNRSDGTVELVAEGPRAACEQLLEFCHHGPPAARVTRVENQWLEAGGDWNQFSVRH